MNFSYLILGWSIVDFRKISIDMNITLGRLLFCRSVYRLVGVGFGWRPVLKTDQKKWLKFDR